MELLETIKAKLNADARFHYRGHGANLGVWETQEKGYDGIRFIDLKKPLAQKGYGGFRIILYCKQTEDRTDQELKIEMYVPSHCEWNTFFEGFVETEQDFDRLLVMLGLA